MVSQNTSQFIFVILIGLPVILMFAAVVGVLNDKKVSSSQKPVDNYDDDDFDESDDYDDDIPQKNFIAQQNVYTKNTPEFKKTLDTHNNMAQEKISLEDNIQIEEKQTKGLKEEIKQVNFPKYEYKFVAIDDISSYNFIKKIQNISNNNAFYGWDYYKLETFIVPPPISFAAEISGEHPIYKQHQYIVFRRPFLKQEEKLEPIKTENNKEK